MADNVELTPKIPENLKLTFREGFIGCPSWQNFRLEIFDDVPWLGILWSLDHKDLSLLVGDPDAWHPEAVFDISSEDMNNLEVSDPGSLAVLAILSVNNNSLQVTANMLAPLMINPTTGHGRQIIQSNRPYLAQQPLTHQIASLTFPEGLVGMPEWKSFVLQKTNETAPLETLVSLHQPDFSFSVVDPWVIDTNYAPVLSIADKVALGVSDEDELKWYCILNIQEPFAVNANLLGPIVIHPRTGLARQVILSNSGYSASQPVKGNEPLSSEAT